MNSSLKKVLLIAGIAALVLIPATGGKIFKAITSGFSPSEKTIPEPGKTASAPGIPATPGEWRESENFKNAAEADAFKAKGQYLEGLKYFQNADYENAKKEWQAAAKLDPGNQDVKLGLQRIEMILDPSKN
jgi:hypothetical protein